MEKNTLESALKEFSQTSGTNANDVKEFFALMSDGSIKRMPKEDMATVLGGLLGVLGINLKISNRSGAGLADGSAGGIVLAVDEDNPFSLLLYAYRFQKGTKAKVLIISSNILSLGDSNDMGTMTVTGGTNVVQYRLGFK